MNNIFVLCLDSARYDVFVAADTPNMDTVGEVRLVHSFSCWTLLGFFMGFPPIGTGRENLCPGAQRYRWVPNTLLSQGYATVWLSTNPSFYMVNLQFQGFFERHFKYYRNFDMGNTLQLINVLKTIVTQEKHPLFVFALLMDTHRPYHWGTGGKDLIPSNPELNFENQCRAVQYVDKNFPRFIAEFKRTGRPTHVTITADHGELFGPEYSGHDPSSQKNPINFDSKLFEIPWIEGVVEP